MATTKANENTTTAIATVQSTGADNVPAANETKNIMPKPEIIYGRTGKVLGTVQCFTADKSYSNVKDALKAAHPMLKGKQLKAMADDVVFGKKDVREQLAVAALQASFQLGYVPDSLKLQNRTGALKLVKIERPVISKEQAVETLAKLSKEERAEMLALLTA